MDENAKSKNVGRAPRPADTEAWIWSYVFSLTSRAHRTTSGLGAFMFRLSPGIPVDVRKVIGNSRSPRLPRTAALAAFFSCFVVPAILCLFDKTLYGHEANHIYFFTDFWNLALYIVVCPLYVAVSCTMIALTIQHWAELAEFAQSAHGQTNDALPGKRLGLALFCTILFTALLMTTYLRDILANEKLPIYWFMQETTKGARVLNSAGYYYLCLNFCLLFVTVSAVLCFFSQSMEVMRLGASFRKNFIQDFSVIRNKLASYTTMYLLAKIIAADYMVNAFIWKDSPLGGTTNQKITGIALTLIGLFFVAFPRVYVELKWYECAYAASLFNKDEDGYQDIRPLPTKRWTNALDYFLIGSFFDTWWNFDFGPGHLIHSFAQHYKH